MTDKYVSDRPVYHENKRYAPGAPLPADVVKHLNPDSLRKQTKAEAKAEDAQDGKESKAEASK